MEKRKFVTLSGLEFRPLGRPAHKFYQNTRTELHDVTVWRRRVAILAIGNEVSTIPSSECWDNAFIRPHRFLPDPFQLNRYPAVYRSLYTETP
jgi:hypothetical protein